MQTQAIAAPAAGRVEITRVTVAGFLAAITRHIQADPEASERTRLVNRERTLARNVADMSADLERARARVAITPAHLDMGERGSEAALVEMLGRVRAAHAETLRLVAGGA